MPDPYDRRGHPRQLVALPLYVRLNTLSSGGILYDVGEGGMALDLLVGPDEVSDDVLVDLDLSSIGEHFEAKGRITWTKGPGNRVGLKFVDLTEASRLQIKKWLSSNEAPPSGASELADFPAWRDGDGKSEISVTQNTVTPEIGQIRRSMTKSKSSRAPLPSRSRRITKLVVGELHENLAIPGSAKGDTSVEHPVLQRENPTGSAALAAMAERPMSPVEGEVAEVEAIGVVSLGPPNERKEPTKKAAFEPVNPTLVPEQSDELVQEIKKWLESV